MDTLQLTALPAVVDRLDPSVSGGLLRVYGMLPTFEACKAVTAELDQMCLAQHWSSGS